MLPGPLRPWNAPPSNQNLDGQTQSFLNWVMSTVNALVNQQIQQGSGLNQVPGSVDPTTSRITSLGSRMQSITTPITYIAAPTSITFYWDGTNGSTPFQVYRDDGTVTPAIKGSLSVTGLTASTTYFIYLYYDEAAATIKPVVLPNGVGSPPLAFTSTNISALQQCILRGRLPVANGWSATGITTPATGTASGSGGYSGGGGAGGRPVL